MEEEIAKEESLQVSSLKEGLQVEGEGMEGTLPLRARQNLPCLPLADATNQEENTCPRKESESKAHDFMTHPNAALELKCRLYLQKKGKSQNSRALSDE